MCDLLKESWKKNCNVFVEKKMLKFVAGVLQQQSCFYAWMQMPVVSEMRGLQKILETISYGAHYWIRQMN